MSQSTSSSSSQSSEPKEAPELKPRRVDFVLEASEFDIKSNLYRIWKNIPLFIKFISILSLLNYFINLIFPSLSFYLSNIPLYSLNHFQFWRLITSVFITTNIFNILIGLIFWLRDASSLETSVGTIKYMIIFIRNSLFIQIFYCFITLVIKVLTGSQNVFEYKILDAQNKLVRNCGFWPIIMCEMTLLCLSNMDTPVKFLFLPCPFKAKFYPIIWFVIFSLINFNHLWDIFEVLIGVIFAIVYHLYLKYYLTITDSFAERLENNVMFQWMKKLGGFVSASYITNKYQKYSKRKNKFGKIIDKVRKGKNNEEDENSKENVANVSDSIIDVIKKDDIIDENKSKEEVLDRSVNSQDGGSIVHEVIEERVSSSENIDSSNMSSGV